MTTKVIYPTGHLEHTVANEDLDGNDSYASYVDAYLLPITLLPPPGTSNGLVRKIYNNAGVPITINSQINLETAPTNTLILDDQAWVLLIFLRNDNIPNQLWRMIDSSLTGVTLL